jgi:hypothetical protein
VSAEAVAGGGDPEAAYYQAVEEFFVSRRGDPLFLSNADWLLIRKWRTAGLPLRVVLRGIADALDSHAHSWARHRKVGSLAYCAAEVDAARDRWERALAVGGDGGPDLAVALAGFAAALDSAATLGPAATGTAADLARELRERAGEGVVAAREVEPWLSAREAALLAAIEKDVGAGEVARLRAGVEAELAPYRDRMPERVLAQIRKDALARRLLAAHGLPRLSLFHL